MPEAQARVVVEAQREAIAEVVQAHSAELATKGDVVSLRADLKALEADMRAIVAEARASTIQWVAALLVAQAAAVAGGTRYPTT